MITRIRGKGEIELRSFALTDMVRYGYSDLRGYPAIGGETAVRGIPAIHRAARIRSEALASLKLKCWKGEGADKKLIDKVWQAKLFAGRANEYQTRFDFWETVGESLAYRNNAYIFKLTDPAYARVVAWYALHPDQIECKGAGRYILHVKQGYIDPIGKGDGQYKIGYDAIIHVRGHGQGGEWEAPSPIKVFRDALASPVARQRHEARMWRKGTSLQLAVSFPQNVNNKQVEEWRETWEATYGGSDGETTAVIGGGAEIKPISMTAADSKFVEMAHLTVEDASRIMGVPSNLLGAPTQTGSEKPQLEEDLMTWLRFGLGPELERIESTLIGDTTLFPALGRTIYPSFDTDAFVRGDIMTEANVLQSRVQSGILTPDEARQTLGYPPHPGGVGAIPQITPVGGAPNPNLNGKPENPPVPALS